MKARYRFAASGVLVAALALIAFSGPAWAAKSYEAPPRYPVRIVGEADLLRVFAAGLVGDAFGYDAGEILYQVRATAMPVEDVVPTFYIAYLSGKSFLEVVEQRADKASWGRIARELGVTADDLNRMAIPGAVSFTAPEQVPDEVLQDMFICSALSYVFDVEPDDLFAYYEAGWSSLDVMAAVNMSYYTGLPMDRWLGSAAGGVDWYREAREADLDLEAIAEAGGRIFDNMVPMMSDEPQRSDLETIYAIEMASDYWNVPIDTVRKVRYRFLYCPSEVMISFYLADLGSVDYYRLGGLYSWNHWRRWGPTIVAVGMPSSYFSGWSVWGGGPVDFYSVDWYLLRDHLLGRALSYNRYVPVYIYDRYDPWFGPRDAIMYCGVYHRYRVPFDDFYAWRRYDRPWHTYTHFNRDYGEWRRSTDWVGRQRVGAIVGEKRPMERHDRVVYTTPSGHSSSIRREPGYAPSGRRVGVITGRKTYDARSDIRGPEGRPGPDGRPGLDGRPGPDARPGPGGKPGGEAGHRPDVRVEPAPRSGPDHASRYRNATGIRGGQPAPGPGARDGDGRTRFGLVDRAPSAEGPRPVTQAPRPTVPEVSVRPPEPTTRRTVVVTPEPRVQREVPSAPRPSVPSVTVNPSRPPAASGGGGHRFGLVTPSRPGSPRAEVSRPAPQVSAPSYSYSAPPSPSPAPVAPTPVYTPQVAPAPSYSPPSYRAPERREPSHSAPSYRPPVYAAPAPAPSYTAPSYSAPSYTPPVYAAPTPAPSYTAPSYGAPSRPEGERRFGLVSGGGSGPSPSSPAAEGPRPGPSGNSGAIEGRHHSGGGRRGR